MKRCLTHPRLVLALLASSVLGAAPAFAQSTLYWSGHLSNHWFDAAYEDGFNLLDSNWVTSPGAAPDPSTVRLPFIDTIVSFTPASTLNLPNTNAGLPPFTIGFNDNLISGIRTEPGLNTTVRIGPDLSPQNLPLSISASGISHNGNGGIEFTGTVRVASSQTWYVGPQNFGTAYIAFIGSITGSANVTKTGPGTVQLSGNNTAFTGSYTQTDGTTQITAGSTLASSNVNLTGGSLTFATNTNFATLSGSTSASIRPVGSSPLTLTIGTDGTNALDTTYLGNLANNSIVPANTLSLTIASAPTRRVLFLGKTGGATHSGATTIRSGAFIATTAPNALSPNSPVVIEAGGNLDISGNNQSIPTLTGAGRAYSFSSVNAVLSVGSATNSTFTGTLINAGASGTFGLTKVGAGTLTLTNNHTYTGPTVVSAGTLDVSAPANGANIGLNLTSSVTVNSGGTLRISSINAYAGNRAGLLPPLTVNAGGTATTANGVATSIDNVILAGGTLASGTPDPTFGSWYFRNSVTATGATTSTITAATSQLQGNIAFNVNSGSTLNITGSLANASGATGALTKTGPGILTLTGTNNTFTGGTTISQGTLVVGSGGILPGAVTVNGPSAILQIGNGTATGTTTGPVTVTSGSLVFTNGAAATGSVTNNATVSVNSSTPITLSTPISGTGTLTQNGFSLVTLTGDNTYTGPTSLINGDLQIGSGGGTGSIVSSISLGSSGNRSLIFNRSGALTYPGNISGFGFVQFTGSGIIRLTGNNTGSSAFFVTNANTLELASDTALSTNELITNGGAIRAAIAARTFGNNLRANQSFTLGRLTHFTGTTSLFSAITVTLDNPDGPANGFSTLSNLSNGSVFGGGSLTVNPGPNGVGTGGLIIAGNGTYDAGTTINTRVRTTSPTALGTGPVVIGSAGELQLTSNLSIASLSGGGSLSLNSNTLTVGSGNSSTSFSGAITTTGTLTKVGTGTLTLAAGPTAPYTLASISITAGAVDLTNNELLLRNQTPASVQSLLATSALRSSSATTFTRLAVFPNEVAPGVPFYSTFFGTPAASTDTLIRLTYTGDTNIDGVLDGADLANLIEGLSTNATGWQNGDFNYDGLVNLADFGLFSTAYNAYQLNPIPLGSPAEATNPTGGGSIPEPGSLGLLGSLGGLAIRRRRAFGRA